MSLRMQKVFHVFETSEQARLEHRFGASDTFGNDESGIATSRIGEGSSSSSSSSSSTGSSLWLLPDNVSHSCNGGMLDGRSGTSSCRASCPHDHLLWKTLRWIKLIAVKVGRSYFALPVAILATVLLLGVLIGFMLGRRYEQKRQSASTTRDCSHPKSAWSLLELQQLLLKLQLVRWCQTCHFWCMLIPVLILNRLRSVEDMRTKPTRNQTTALDSSASALPASALPVVYTAPEPGVVDTTAALSSIQPPLDLDRKEERTRLDLKSDDETKRESRVPMEQLPRHVAVIMDGNRRYGMLTHNSAVQGHWDGSRKLLQFAKWCLAEHIPELTVYAFSTENWQRDAAEVSALMGLILRHCEELRVEAKERCICVRIISTDSEAIPRSIRQALQQLQDETNITAPQLVLNICLSYGSRGEIVHACRSIAKAYRAGSILTTRHITEESLSAHMHIHSDPDILIRTSGEMRISNFMLWQLAYTELFFLPKNWPELDKQDLLQVLQSFALGRKRRFGK